MELINYDRPSGENSIQQALANILEIRNIAFVVEVIESVVAKWKAKGQEIFGEIQNHEESYRLCYVR